MIMNPLRRLLFPAARARPPDAPSPGMTYYDEGARGAREIARVLGGTTDALGVGHVRFELIYRYQQKTLSAGERTLSLSAFRRRFPRRLDDDDTPA